MNHYLGIDIGTSGTKTLLIDSAGKVLAEANAEYPLHQPKPGWTEQDPEDWWKATVKTVRAVMKKVRLETRSGSRDRTERPDAWLGLPGQERQSDSQCAALERPANGGGVRRNHHRRPAAART